MTQAASFEEARESLVDAIEVWLMSGLRGAAKIRQSSMAADWLSRRRRQSRISIDDWLNA
jgi:hypothetical protein